MKQIISVLTFIISLGSSAQAQTISFESSVRYKKVEDATYMDLPDNANMQIKKGEGTIVVTRSGMPILVYVPFDSKSNLKITDAQLQQLLQEQLQGTINQIANNVIDGIRKTEGFLKKRDLPQALINSSQLKQKYPRIASVLFLSATVQYLNNNKPGAVEDLTEGLKIDPSNESANKLLRELKGGSQ